MNNNILLKQLCLRLIIYGLENALDNNTPFFSTLNHKTVQFLKVIQDQITLCSEMKLYQTIPFIFSSYNKISKENGYSCVENLETCAINEYDINFLTTQLRKFFENETIKLYLQKNKNSFKSAIGNKQCYLLEPLLDQDLQNEKNSVVFAYNWFLTLKFQPNHITIFFHYSFHKQVVKLSLTLDELALKNIL